MNTTIGIISSFISFATVAICLFCCVKACKNRRNEEIVLHQQEIEQNIPSFQDPIIEPSAPDEDELYDIVIE